MRTSVVLVSAIVFGGFAGTYLRTSPSVAAASGQPPTELVEIAGRLDDIQRRLNEHDQYFNNIQGVFNQLGASNLESRLNCLDVKQSFVITIHVENLISRIEFVQDSIVDYCQTLLVISY